MHPPFLYLNASQVLHPRFYENDRWVTLLPGFPDEPFGYAQIDEALKDDMMGPRLCIEYVGQGDSQLYVQPGTWFL